MLSSPIIRLLHLVVATTVLFQIVNLLLPVQLLVLTLLFLTWPGLQRYWQSYGKTARPLLLLLSLAVLIFTYRGHFGLEASVSLLVIGACFKMTELRTTRDIQLLIVLALLNVAVSLLFDQSLLNNLLAYGLLITILAALIVINGGELSMAGLGANVKTVMWLILQGLPIIVFLFFTVPRLPPLWAVPQVNKLSQTGMSDQLALGGVGELARDTRLAFRARFEGAVPSVNEMYWAGAILDDYDGQTWRQSDVVSRKRPWSKSLGNEGFIYQIILEPNNQRWLYALRPVRESSEGYLTRAGVVISDEFVTNRLSYRVVSGPVANDDPVLSESDRRHYLLIPNGEHPRAEQLAKQLKGATGRQTVGNIQRYFTDQLFTYSLRPGRTEDDAIDDFLFVHRKGFCEYFAASTAVLLRYAGVPARLIGGYQGGEVNPLSDTYSVYQYDAHAWVEWWSAGEGWQRLDPTAWAAPDRIELGMGSVAANTDYSGDNWWFASVARFAWLADLRQSWEFVNYRWLSFMLNFDGETQNDFLKDLLGEVTPARLLMLAAVAALLSICIWMLLLVVQNYQRMMKKPSSQRQIQAIFVAFLKRYPVTYSSCDSVPKRLRLMAEAYPEQGEKLFEASELAQRYLYDPQTDRAELIRQLKRLL